MMTMMTKKYRGEAGIVYDTSEKDGRYEPIRTDPENETLQLHTDGEMP